MSDATAQPGSLFAPPGGWRVRIVDHSGGNEAEDDVVDEIAGFGSLMEANAFARAYVRDSVELCRDAGLSADEIASLWRSFGEDAYALDAGDGAWRSATEIADFAVAPSGAIERDWRALDPRRRAGDHDREDDEDEGPLSHAGLAAAGPLADLDDGVGDEAGFDELGDDERDADRDEP